jgi:isoamylase
LCSSVPPAIAKTSPATYSLRWSVAVRSMASQSSNERRGWGAADIMASCGSLRRMVAQGPTEPHRGLRFDGDKALLDPYGRCVAVPSGYDRMAASAPGANTAVAMKSVVADCSGYDWEGDAPLRRPFPQTLIYEMHLAGFTRHPSSGVAPERRGTYAGLIEKIPYLKELGITAVELLPVFQFDPFDAPPGRVNYWGYAPVSSFAPHQGYSSCTDPLGALDEFRDMVKSLHRAGIEVILDVVFNHTAEGDDRGPTFCFKGFQNVGDFWKEWNGQFRDDVRAFVTGDRGTVPRLASRLLASPDVYGHEEREPE